MDSISVRSVPCCNGGREVRTAERCRLLGAMRPRLRYGLNLRDALNSERSVHWTEILG